MTNAEAWFNNYLRPWKPEGSLGRTAQDVHLDSHTAPELSLVLGLRSSFLNHVLNDTGHSEYSAGFHLDCCSISLSFSSFSLQNLDRHSVATR